jgi:hypothetical protein
MVSKRVLEGQKESEEIILNWFKETGFDNEITIELAHEWRALAFERRIPNRFQTWDCVHLLLSTRGLQCYR